MSLSLIHIFQREPKPEREELTPQQQAALLDFMDTDAYCRRYRDLFIVLLHTCLFYTSQS